MLLPNISATDYEKVWSGYYYVRKDVQEVFDVLEKWYQRIQDGSHVMYQPDPFYEMNRERADRLVEAIDRDFKENEGYRLEADMFSVAAVTGGNIGLEPEYGALPEMSRLCPNARVAMWQEIKKLLEYQNKNFMEYLTENAKDRYKNNQAQDNT